MKKLLMIVMAFVGITNTAMAAPKEYKAADGFLCARVDTSVNSNNPSETMWQLNGNPYSYATIFFDTGIAAAHTGCEDIYKEVADSLKSQKGDIEQLVFIGSADEQGMKRGYDNTTLAYNRSDYVRKLFDEGFSYKTYVAGDADAEKFSSKTNNQEFRTVDIYVIWRLPVCGDGTQRIINGVNNVLKLENVKNCTMAATVLAKDHAVELGKICSTKDTTLSASSTENYLDTVSKLTGELNSIIRHCPKITEKEVEIINTVIQNCDIDIYYNYLNGVMVGLGRSVWKDKEGNFNTARLASDSIAGVVLGTAGGLITSHLVKKGQIKDGFEGIQCTIAGQTVADWGDEFRVGVQ